MVATIRQSLEKDARMAVQFKPTPEKYKMSKRRIKRNNDKERERKRVESV